MWIKTKDELPERLQVVDVYSPYDGRVADVKYIGYPGNEEWASHNMRWRGPNVITHWMPIPELPKE